MLVISSIILFFILIIVISLTEYIESQIILPWLILLIMICIFSLNENNIFLLSTLTGIQYPPLAIILGLIFIIICISLSLAIYLTKLKIRQKKLLKTIAIDAIIRQYHNNAQKSSI